MKKRNKFLRLMAVALTCSLALGGVVAQPEVVNAASTTARQMESLSRGLVA